MNDRTNIVNYQKMLPKSINMVTIQYSTIFFKKMR